MLNDRSGPVILDIEGCELLQYEREILHHPQVGGLILFSRNFQSPEQLRNLVREIRQLRPNLLICVDHEGGRVQRFREGFTHLPPMQCLGQVYARSPQEGLAQARELGWLMAAELLDCDLDLSFAPVLDVDDHQSDIIGDRAFAADPEVVASLASAFIDGMHEAGMAATGKHFPGHGGVKADSHLELPVDPRDWQVLCARDLIPFKALSAKLDALMSAHIVFPQIDSELVSFSRHWLVQCAREQLGFKGLIFSDDLSMEGAAGAGAYAERAESALSAGCDVVLVCNRPAGTQEVIEHLERSSAPGGVRHRPDSLRHRANADSQVAHQKERWRRAVALATKLHEQK